ncbi:MAG: Ig-like domain-containing protein, partial [Gammaproteobacteria bacterium]|nr:Ig-like domain-containing protein [Gammaproteobacteria bacterium]
GLVVTQSTTDVNGTATASLTTAGDPTNRVITVTATSGALSQTIDINVTGSQLSIAGPNSLVQGDTSTYTIVMIDGAGTGIAGQTITLTSANGNTLSAATLTTDVAGQAQVDLTATTGGTDTLTATGLGLTATQGLTVSADSFVFNAPAANTEIALNTNRTFTVAWLTNGVPQVGETINFSTTRGVFVGPSTVVTNGAGQATVTISSNNAGPAIVTADAVTGPTTQLPVEFVATTPASIEIQADPFTIAPNNQATITAVVRDTDNNRVKNARVIFTLEDITGGTLSVGSGITDSQGRAQTFYTASDVTSGNLAVVVSGTVEIAPMITNSVNLTVARRELFIAFGTGNDLIEPPDLATYEMPFRVIVTDSEGNGVPGVTVQFDVRSTRYTKGWWVLDITGDFWTTNVLDICIDEDLNGNGILDAGEIDENGNGTIEAGNVVEVVPGNAMTNDEGTVLISIRYAKSYGAWTEVNLRALLNVAGTEFSEDVTFVLQVLADDVRADGAPPGILSFPDPNEPGTPLGSFIASPWGYGDICAKPY